MLDPHLLAQPRFLASISGALFTGLAVVGLMSYAPALMQQSLHISEIGSAAVLAAWSATSMVVALAAGSLPSRLPAQTRLLIGLSLAAVGELALTGLGTGTGWTRLVPGLFVTGLGTGLVNAALGRIAVESVPHGRVGMGSGANNTARYLGGAAGAALVVSIASAGGAHALIAGWNIAAARVRRAMRARGGDRRELPQLATPYRSPPAQQAGTRDYSVRQSQLVEGVSGAPSEALGDRRRRVEDHPPTRRARHATRWRPVRAKRVTAARRSPSPAGEAESLVVGDGTRISLRQVGADDRDGLAALFARLSPQSRHQRFLSPKLELTPRELTFFTDVDHLGHEATVAVDPRDNSIVGIARYVRDADRADVADVAIEVADAFHRMGIGSALASLTIQRAHANGFTLLTGTTLRENRAARGLLRLHGFRARRSRGGEIQHELDLEELGLATANADPRPRPATANADPRPRHGLPRPPTAASSPRRSQLAGGRDAAGATKLLGSRASAARPSITPLPFSPPHPQDSFS